MQTSGILFIIAVLLLSSAVSLAVWLLATGRRKKIKSALYLGLIGLAFAVGAAIASGAEGLDNLFDPSAWWDRLAEGLTWAYDKIGEAIKDLGGAIKDAALFIVSVFMSVVRWVFDSVARFFNWITGRTDGSGDGTEQGGEIQGDGTQPAPGAPADEQPTESEQPEQPELAFGGGGNFVTFGPPNAPSQADTFFDQFQSLPQGPPPPPGGGVGDIGLTGWLSGFFGGTPGGGGGRASRPMDVPGMMEPGALIQGSDGETYIVQSDGSLLKIEQGAELTVEPMTDEERAEAGYGSDLGDYYTQDAYGEVG